MTLLNTSLFFSYITHYSCTIIPCLLNHCCSSITHFHLLFIFACSKITEAMADWTTKWTKGINLGEKEKGRQRMTHFTESSLTNTSKGMFKNLAETCHCFPTHLWHLRGLVQTRKCFCLSSTHISSRSVLRTGRKVIEVKAELHLYSIHPKM